MRKRVFDIGLAFLLLCILGCVIFPCILIASIDTNSFGLFIQSRIGQHGIPFNIFKIKTFSDSTQKISKFGHLLRSYKLDELPQLFNILLGQMSFVGPRPDLVGYADLLEGSDRIILSIKPGITGLASLKYRNEEALLDLQINPNLYNDAVIWPDKVRINKWYVENRTLWMDLRILYYTIIPINFDVDRFMRDRE